MEAVCFALLVIGEAATHVPDGVQVGAPQVPWRKMKGMRDIAAHEYSASPTGIRSARVHVRSVPRCEGNGRPLVDGRVVSLDRSQHVAV